MHKKYYLLILLFFLALSPCQALAQAKVGTTGAQFLNLRTSVRSLAMGSIGVSLPDPAMHRTNPGTIAMSYPGSKLLLSLDPLISGYPDGMTMFDASGIYTFGFGNESMFRFATGISYVRLKSGEMIERDYYQGDYDGTNRTFSWKDESVSGSIGFMYSNDINIGVGFSAFYINESSIDYNADGIAFSLGSLLKWEVQGSEYMNGTIPYSQISIGGSFNYLGSKMNFISNEYPLPREMIVGVAYEYGRKNNSGKIWSLISAVEVSDIRDNGSRHHIGLEANLHHWAALRGGYIDDQNSGYTFGCSLQLDQVLSLVIPSIKKSNSILKNLHLTYVFAMQDNDLLHDVDFHGVTLNF